MTDKAAFKAISIVAFTTILLIILWVMTAPTRTADASGQFTLGALTAATSSAVQVGPQENVRVAASSSRAYLYIANPSAASVAVYCKGDGDKAAVLGQGILIASTTAGFYEWFLEKNAYDGAVRCTAAASTTVSVTEYLVR